MSLESESIADLDSANNIDAIESNGSCKNDEEILDDENSLRNGLNSATSDSNFVSSVNDGDGDGDGDADAVEKKAVSETPPPKKGFGLKKWRRIRRNDHVGGPKTDSETGAGKEKEKEDDSDSTGRMLKRGSANILGENENGGSSNSIKIESNTPIMASASSAFAVAVADAPTFNAGADSDNSDDGHSHSHRSSSKSSTAATTKLRSSAKHRSQLPLPKPQPPGDPSKKSKGGSELDLERERENSPLSSMGSDSICSNSVVFLRGSNSVLPNPPLPESSSDQAQNSPPAEAGGAHSPDSSSDQLSSTAANVKDHRSPGDGGGDPLVESILMLQSAQLALQAEVQKFGEIGKGICSLCDDSDKTGGIPVSTMSGDAGLYMDRTSDGLNEFNHAYLSKSIQTLERQLNEAEGILKEKELRIAEYETAMRSSESLQDLARSALEQQYRKCSELEGEVQDLIKQKLEAEIQSVVITRSTKESIVLVEDWIKLMGEQKSVISEQTQFLKTVVDVEHKTAMRQEQTEKLDTHNIGTVDSEEILKMQKGIVKLSKRLFIQLVLLGCVFALFVLQLGPKSAVVVPT